MFPGNMDSHHIRTLWLETPVTARFVRVHVLEWHRRPALRLEILGCQGLARIYNSNFPLLNTNFQPFSQLINQLEEK